MQFWCFRYAKKAGTQEINQKFPIFTGWVSSVHWGTFAVCEVILVHVVQPSSGQEEILQKTWEANVTRGGATLQGRTTGKFMKFIEIFTNFRSHILEWETRSKTKMGLALIRKAPKRHNAGMSRRFCTKYYWEASVDMRAVKSRSEGQDEADRLPTTSW